MAELHRVSLIFSSAQRGPGRNHVLLQSSVFILESPPTPDTGWSLGQAATFRWYTYVTDY